MSTWNRGKPQAKGVVVYHRPWTAREDRWPSSVVKGGEAAGEEKGDGAAVGGRPQPLMAATDGVSVCASSRVLETSRGRPARHGLLPRAARQQAARTRVAAQQRGVGGLPPRRCLFGTPWTAPHRWTVQTLPSL